MSDLEITIFNQKLKLSYQENEKDRLINAVDVLNKSWNKFSNIQGKVSSQKIITLISLELQDSIREYKDELYSYKQNIDLLKKEIEEKSQLLKTTNEKLNTVKLETENKDREILKMKNALDEIHQELLQIKNNIFHLNK
tara:strand:+ start:252 stop:668 length:417 start_codon:yes stop_codon:yes gene_type:complete